MSEFMQHGFPLTVKLDLNLLTMVSAKAEMVHISSKTLPLENNETEG